MAVFNPDKIKATASLTYEGICSQWSSHFIWHQSCISTGCWKPHSSIINAPPRTVSSFPWFPLQSKKETNVFTIFSHFQESCLIFKTKWNEDPDLFFLRNFFSFPDIMVRGLLIFYPIVDCIVFLFCFLFPFTYFYCL